MEINYNLIIKYLGNKKTEETFSSLKNIMTTSDKFPSEFRGLLGDKFYKIGVTSIFEKKNISFYTSIMTLLDDDFMTLDLDEEKHKVSNLIDVLQNLNDMPDNLKEISKGAIKKYIKEVDTNIWIMELLVHKMKINILILDFDTMNIQTVYPGLVMNPWRPFFLLAKQNNNWEPIRNNEKKSFSYNDNFIKKIINYGISYYDEAIIKKEFVLVDNLQEIIEEFNDNKLDNEIKDYGDKLESTSEEESNETFIKKEINLLSESKLNKMTKPDLIKYMKELDLKPNSKLSKKDLIKTVLQN